MATSTTNYGFDVPTSSDLVKNGATQIALLGQDLDTFLFRPFSKNVIINGGFDIWQRSTSATLVTVGSYIAPDRMACTSDSGGNGTASQVTSSLPTGFRYALKLQRTAANTSVGIISVAQFLETSNSTPLAGQIVTVSFWAKAGANFSAGSSALLVRGFTGTGTDQAGGFGTWTGYAEPISANPLITTSWVRYSVTGTLSSSATQFGIRIGYTPVGTAGADDSLQITGIQAEIGSQVTPFTRASNGSVGAELALCKYYYSRYTSNNNYGVLSTGIASNTGTLQVMFPFPTGMRVVPTAVDTSAMATFYFEGGASNGNTPTTVTIGTNGSVTCGHLLVNKAAAFVSGMPYSLNGNNTATAFIGFSAEL